MGKISIFLEQKRSSLFVFLVLAIIFAIIEFKGLTHIDPGDEHVYFYMGKLIAEGYLPYKDFFLAHPPLLVLFPAISYKIFGFSLFMLKAIELSAIILSAYFIYLIAKHRFNAIIALTSVFFFFSSKTILFESSYYLGMGLTTLFFLIGVYFALNKNSYFTAGLFMALSALTRLNAVILIIIFALILLFSRDSKKSFLRFVIGFLSLFLAVNILLYLIAGYDFVQSVYLFHLLKVSVKSSTVNILADFIKENSFLVISFLLFIFTNKREISTFLLLSASYLVFLILSKRIFNFYLVILIPFIAIVAAYSVYEIFERYKEDNLVKYSIAVVLLLIAISNISFSLNKLYNYDLIDFRYFHEIRNLIEENSKPEDTVFGDANSAPMFALLANRRIALNMPDTNLQVFLAGIINIRDIIDNLKNAGVKLILVKPDIGIGNLPEFQSYLKSNCKLLKEFNDSLRGNYMLYKC